MTNPFHYTPDPYVIYGLKVSITPDTPKMQLAPGDYVTPEFREEINRWMVDFFGVTNILLDGQVIKYGDRLAMNQRTYRKAKEAIQGEKA